MLEKIKDKYIKLKKKTEKKGMNTLEFMFIMLIFMLMLGFFFDMFIILNQHYVAEREASIITRQIAMQGGVEVHEPSNYNRFGQDYATSLNIHQRVNNRLDGVNIENYTLYINRHSNDTEDSWMELTPGTILPIPYQENFEFVLEYEYEWLVMGQFLDIPGLGDARTRKVQRSAVSELGGGSVDE